MKTLVNKEFTQLCVNKYKEMIELGQEEEFLDQKEFGSIKVFVNPPEKPKYILTKFKSENNLDKIYIGGTF